MKNRRVKHSPKHPTKPPKTQAVTKDNEPAVTRGVVVGVLVLLASLGVGWAADPSPQTIGALVAVGGFLVPILQGLWTRFVVTPSAQVLAQVKPSGEVVAGEAAPVPTGAPVAVQIDTNPDPIPPRGRPGDLF